MTPRPLRFHEVIWKNLLRRRLRSALTVAGAATAVAAVVSLVSLAQWFERSSLAEYRNRGVDLVVVRRGVSEHLSSNLEESLDETLRGLADVADVAGSLNDLALLGDDSAIGVPLRGWPADSFAFEGLTARHGRRLTTGDQQGVMLGASLAEALQRGIGDKVEIEGRPFHIVGTFDSPNVVENGWAIVRLVDLQSLMDRPHQVTEFQIRLRPSRRSDNQVQSVRASIESLATAAGEPLGLAAYPTEQFVSGNIRVRLAHALTWITSTIALIVGALGMLNTMLMAVLERTHEISILRALGWPPRRVARIVLGESIVLAMLGMAFGLAASGLLLSAVRWLPVAHGVIQAQLTWPACLVGAVCAFICAAVGGGYPAWRGARISLAEALRYE